MLKRRIASPAAAHWSKDFVEHLRTVHFALIAISVGLILILSRHSSSALSQITQIIELKKEWPPEQLATIGHIRYLGSSDMWRDLSGMTQITARYTRPGSGEDSVVNLEYTGPFSYLFPASKDAHNIFNGFPETLKEFSSWWNKLTDQHLYYTPMAIDMTGTVDLSDGQEQQPLEVTRLCGNGFVASHANGQIRIVYGPLTCTAQGSLPLLTGALLSYDKGPPRIVLRAKDNIGNEFILHTTKLRESKLDQDVILKYVDNKGWKWEKGVYERSFAALAQDAAGLEFEELTDVQRTLAAREANRTQEFEAFGMRIPIGQITVWGTVILVGVQVYFFLYLRQLSGKLGPEDPCWDIPWICMNQSRLAKAISFSTLVALPGAAMLLIGYRAFLRAAAGYLAPSYPWHFLVPLRGWSLGLWATMGAYLSANIATMVLGTLSWYYRPRLGDAKNSRRPEQLFE